MGVAALCSWVVTWLAGLFLLMLWTFGWEKGMRPGPGLVVPHGALATLGLWLWIVFLVVGRPWGWVAAGVLGAVALFGGTMFSRWLPKYKTYEPGHTFPLPLVVGHGLLAGTTATLVLVTLL